MNQKYYIKFLFNKSSTIKYTLGTTFAIFSSEINKKNSLEKFDKSEVL